MNKAEQKALEAYPKVENGKIWTSTFGVIEVDKYAPERKAFQKGYEQAEKDFLAIVKQYIEKGERCMEQEGESQIYAFWDGFHNCAENILRELEKE